FFYRQMPILVEKGYIYIAQPPLYKVKYGRTEQYLKDGAELDAFLLTAALDGAQIQPDDGKKPISGDLLEELARQYLQANAVLDRLSQRMDREALQATLAGISIELETRDAVEKSAASLAKALPSAEVSADYDATNGEYMLRISRRHFGNRKVTLITADFIQGADYDLLSNAGARFRDLIACSAIVRRGEGERRKEAVVNNFAEAMAWLMAQSEQAVGRQRYKGLGEMNPEQLWETTMDPSVRRLMKVQIEDAIAADHLFTMLMGDEVEPRRHFIENNALRVANIDL
ncbi:MAG: DNA gyrase subunit B, partial [Burkholderiaceae bacterium]